MTAALTLPSFLYGERMAESSDNYTDPAGAYGMISPYFGPTATAAGYPQYASDAAGQVPAAAQDAIAAYLASQNYNQYGSWQNAAEAWYNPATVGQENYTPPGNSLTMGQYAARVLGFAAQYTGSDPNSPSSSTTPATSTGIISGAIGSALAGPLAGATADFTNWATKAMFVVLGLSLAALGVWKLANPGKSASSSVTQAAKSLGGDSEEAGGGAGAPGKGGGGGAAAAAPELAAA